jgi:hypothetical protein
VKKKIFLVLLACAAVFVFSSFAAAQALPFCSEPGSIMSVKKSRVGKFEYVTFELKANDPHYEILNVKPPFTDYGDRRVRIKGTAFKSIQFHLVPTECRIRENFRAATTTVQGVASTEQFEGYVTYVIGYTSKSKYVGVTATGVGSTKVALKFKR